MSGHANSHPNDCGCCAGVAPQTPADIYNRPGLPALAYRVGVYATFKQSLRARLSDARWPVLQLLRSRDQDDFTIALLDAWAMAGDVLTFYQERIANESYLRTATERLSILEQSRLIGYDPAAGLAASTHLVFTLEDAPGAPEQAAKPLLLAAGTRAQSIPGPGEEAQTFETIEAIEARANWNAIRAQLTEAQLLDSKMTELWLDGANLVLAVGDVLLIAVDGGAGMQASLRRVTQIQPDAAGHRTRLRLQEISSEPQPVESNKPGVWVMRATTSPFGHNAPLRPDYKDGQFQNTFSEWPLEDEPANRLTLSARCEKILVGSWVVIEQDDPDSSARLWIFAKVTKVTNLSVAKYGIAGNATRVSLSASWKKNSDSKLSLLRTMTVTAQSEELTVAQRPLAYPVYGKELPLDSRVDGLRAGQAIAVTGKRQRLRITERADGPVLNLHAGGSVLLKPDDTLAMAKRPAKLGGGAAQALSPEEFDLALNQEPPPLLRLQITDRDGQSGTVNLKADAIALEPVADGDESVSEIAFIDGLPATAVIEDRDRTTVTLAGVLAHVYERTSVRVNANVAAATQGETVREILGSGDATVPYQSFTLRQSPLTYVSADTPRGSQSTLKVYVNDVLWQEAPFFYGRGAGERIYIARRDDAGRTTVQFGDGLAGARLPTGQNNVRAEYRKGVGLGGLVKTGQISQLLSRPLGLKEVVNREDAQGAEDPESRDDARANAPLTVLTLDRAVSLQDYEDFSRTFSGIAKAQAVWVWDGRKRTVFITVAGIDGATLDEDGAVIAALKEALRSCGDPYVAFTVKNLRKVLFRLAGTVTIHANHVADTVMASVAANLRERYSFAAREFGQSVALSEIIAVIQSAPGVVTVDIDSFYRNDAPEMPLRARLDAERPAMGADGVVVAAEMLLLDETSLSQLSAQQ
jgi:hypothetical protein